MLVAALDSTTRSGSVALAEDGRVLGLTPGDATRAHAERLPGSLIDLLARLGRRLEEIDVFAVAAGPGSFTGLRIGIATIQGLAFAAKRPVVAVSALEALAAAAAAVTSGLQAASLVAAWIDAQRGEVFSAIYRVTEPPPGVPVAEGQAWPPMGLEQVEEPAVAGPEATLERWRRARALDSILFAGDGALAYRAAIRAALGADARIVEPTPWLAPAIAAIATDRASRGETIGPHAIRPIYVRRPDAELSRDKDKAV